MVVAAFAFYYPFEKIDTPAEELEYREVGKGEYGAIEEKKGVVVRSSEEWADLWADLFPTQQIASAINFDENMLIAVFSGEKSTGGYSVEIKRVDEFADKIQVSVIENMPGEGCIVTQALTSPYHIVEIDKSSKPVEFSFSNNTINC